MDQEVKIFSEFVGRKSQSRVKQIAAMSATFSSLVVESLKIFKGKNLFWTMAKVRIICLLHADWDLVLDFDVVHACTADSQENPITLATDYFIKPKRKSINWKKTLSNPNKNNWKKKIKFFSYCRYSSSHESSIRFNIEERWKSVFTPMSMRLISWQSWTDIERLFSDEI